MAEYLKSFFRQKTTKQAIIKIIIIIVASLFLTWLLEYRHFLNNADETWEFVFTRMRVFLYNALIMLTILGIIYGIIRKTFLSISINTALVLIIGYVHISKFNFRGTPLLPEDFQFGSQAGILTKFIDVSELIRLIIAVILVIILGIILDKIADKWLEKESFAPSNVWWKRYRIVSRVAIIAVAFSGFLVTTDFARHHSKEREIPLPALDSKFTDWNQVANYADNGFLLGFLYNTMKLDIPEPDGYSKQKMQELKRELSEKKQQDDISRTDIANADYNIIVVLNESFYDPSLISDYYNHTGGDVTPNLHKIQEKTLSGYMYSPDYGGGTANIEYEIITGLTNYWLKTVPYTNLVLQEHSVPSLANYMKEHGKNTATIHPFNGGMYKRDAVLPKLGFNDFITQTEFSHTEKEGTSEYINDRSTYEETLEYIKKTKGRDFISLITMQNHAPYTDKEYGESEFKVTNVTNENEKNSVETYLMTLHKSDAFLGEFIEKLDNLDEKTIVLFYGDHSPGVFPQVVENSDKSISDLVRLTPYFIYANFDLDNQLVEKVSNQPGAIEYKDIITRYHTNLPTTTPNCLPNTLLNLLNLEKPINYYLLDTVCNENPVLTETYFGEKAPQMSTDLSNYQLLSYDLVAGKQYFQK
ncbi:LTA synthase family protein [Candidatus Saccharibacteria bacterium]|nr:LTA synthase family protein [Candidatus Saccharibacteria bacterium]